MDKDTFRIAVASSDGIVVNNHFGRAKTFYIYEKSSDETERLIEKREVIPICECANHDEIKLKDNRFADSKYVNPKEFIEALSDKLPDDAIYVADVGQNQIFSCSYHIVKKGKFLTSGGMGTMGYSIPAALGAKLANPSKQVVAVCGDGSFQMSMCEMATVKQENANIKIIVFKNGYLGMVREYQHFTYKDNYSVVELNDYPNLKLLAEAYDFDYRKITYDEELSFIEDFLRSDSPGIMEVNINPADVVKG